MSFKDIKGEAAAVSFLKNVFSAGRVANAYIFLGPSGCGRKLAAVNFAKLLNCAAPIGQEPCEACPSCARINSSSHPDIKILERKDGKAEFGIDIVLEAIRSISLKAYEARMKVYIVDEADLMSEEASNAVLKTLEEPPQDSVLILIVEDMHLISETIRSRSQVVKFFPMPVGEIEGILKEEYELEGSTAKVLAGLSQGSIGRALEYSKTDFLGKRERVIEGLRTGRIFDSDFEKMKRGDFIAYLDIMLSWYRDVLIAKACRADISGAILNIDRSKDIVKDALRLSFEYLDNAVNAIADTRSNLDRNANPKLSMSVLGIRLEGRS